jgi:hypothetical protein
MSNRLQYAPNTADPVLGAFCLSIYFFSERMNKEFTMGNPPQRIISITPK